MTNLEAIKARANYPLSENSFILALLNRELSSAGIYASCQAFDLAYADLITTLVSAPNIQEGGFNVSLTDKTNLLRIADAIYTKYSELNPLSSLKPTATFVQRW